MSDDLQYAPEIFNGSGGTPAPGLSGSWPIHIGVRRYIYKDCPDCGGSGQISHHNNYGSGMTTGGIGTCPACDGRGVIKTEFFFYD